MCVKDITAARSRSSLWRNREPNCTAPATNLQAGRPKAMQSTSDEVLIGRIANGDRLAMQVLYARHHVRVFRFVVRLVRDETTAEDVISEVFLDVWRQAGRFEGRSSVSTWMLAIARFKALSALRRRTDEELDEEGAAADRGCMPTIRRSRWRRRTRARRSEVSRRSFAAAPGDHRSHLLSRQIGQEVAEIVGIPENTVKTRMFYARKRLAELLKAQGIERGWP